MIRFSRVAVAVHLSAAQQIFSALLPQQNAVPLEKTPGIGPEALRGRDSNPRRMFFRHRSTLLNYRARQHLTRHVFIDVLYSLCFRLPRNGQPYPLFTRFYIFSFWSLPDQAATTQDAKTPALHTRSHNHALPRRLWSIL